MNITVLDIATLGNDLNFDSIHKFGDIKFYDVTFEKDVVDRIKDAEVLILNKVKLNKENLPYAKKLKLICITATGFDNVDIDYCREHNIAVCNVIGYSTNSVVQLTLSMVFSLATHLDAYNSFVKSGDYTNSNMFNRITPVFYELANLTWGVVGLGNIGYKVATVAKTIGCNVIAYKREKIDEFECVDIDTLCEKSDIITLHTPLNDGTFHLINEKRIAKMKKNVILVNVARGNVVDEEAVCNAVLDGRIGALGIDVYSVEPMHKDSPYQKLLNKDNVIFTPHMAWGAFDARQRCIDEISKNIESFVNGGKRSRVV